MSVDDDNEELDCESDKEEEVEFEERDINLEGQVPSLSSANRH